MPAGRPTLYEGKKTCKTVFKLCLLGSTDKQIADILEISEATLNNWKNEHAEFLECFRKGRTEAHSKVAKNMYKRANGYRYEEITVEKEFVQTGFTDDDGAPIMKEVPKSVKRVTKAMPPDVGAGKFILVNRQPEAWADKAEVKATNLNMNMNVEPTPEEAAKIKEALDKSI